MHRTNKGPDYRTLMDDIEMPNRVQDRIMVEVRRQRAVEARYAASPRPIPRMLPRRRFVGGAIAAACVLAFGGTAVLALVAKPDDDPSSSSAGNWFALLAYANENPDDEPGKTVTLNMDDFGHDSAWKVWRSDPEIDPNNADNAPDEGQRYLSVAYQFNLSCTGTNIASLTYEVEGERVLFYTRTTSFDSANWESEPSIEEDRTTRFTVEYDDQQQKPAELWRALRVSFPLEGELAELYDAAAEKFISGYRSDADIDQLEHLNVVLLRRYADMIAQARLHLTATYEDGSAETKTYAIAPVENLEEVELAYATAVRAQSKALQENPAGHFEQIPPPELFTLTELV